MKLLALSVQADSGLLARISGALSGFTETDTQFSVFPTLKTMLPAFAEALKDESLIVLAIDKAKFNTVRLKLCAALSLELEQNDEIYRLLAENTALSPEEITKNAAVPKDARLFLTEDGMYSGLAVQKGAQCILFLPLDAERLDRILKNGVIPYLLRCEMPPEKKLPKVQTPSPSSVQTDAFSPDVVQHTLNILRESSEKVAVSGTPAAEILKSLGAAYADFEEFFVFTPHVEDKGDYNLTDYAALMAKSAKELAGASFGACISDIGSGDGGDFICITVADDKTAVVRKLYREADETENSFMHDAAEELIELIGEKAAGKGAVGIEVPGAVSKEPQRFLSTTAGKVTLSVIALLLVAAVVAGCVFLIKEKQHREAETTTLPPATTEAPTTQAPVTVETVPLSVLMYREMRNGIQETPAEITTENAAGTAIDTSDQANTVSEIPDTMLVNGRTLDAKEAVARMIEVEMDSSFNEEAIKAQAVAVYTYLKYRNTNWKITGVTLADEYSDEVYNAVRSVFGEYLSFGNTPAFTPFFRLSAGRTTAADAVFGQNLPYLRTVECATDKTQDDYETVLIFSAEDMRAILTAYDANLTLDEDPGKWIEIIRHDGAVNTGVGYVETISVGGKEISGIEFVETVMAGKNLPSHCFEITYNTEMNEFTLSIYGVGCGVGMSQLGADKMAATGSSYAEILSKFYAGTQLTA